MVRLDEAMINLSMCGSVHMLQTLLEMTGHHYIGPVTMDHLVLAVDRGNIHFVRLLLKLHGQSRDFKPSATNILGRAIYVFRFPGIDVDMLKLLKEMGALSSGLCSRALEHCITNRRVESVQYILEVAKEFDEQQRIEIDREVQTSIMRHTRLGHLDIIQSLLSVAPSNHRTNYSPGSNLSRVAAENGHMHIIEHLHKNNIGNDSLRSAEESTIMELMITRCGDQWDQVMVSRVLYKRVLDQMNAALRRGDQSTAMDILNSHWDKGLSSKAWSYPTELLITFLSIHKSNHTHGLTPGGLCHIVQRISDGRVSLEHGLEYLRNAMVVAPDEPDDDDDGSGGEEEHILKQSSMNLAAGFSLALLLRVKEMTLLDYDYRCLEAAIEHDRLDVISYLLANNFINGSFMQSWTFELLFTKGSVDAIKIVHQHVKLDKPNLCVNSIKNSLEVFKHVMEYVHPPSSLSPRQHRSIINAAVVQDKVNHLKHLIDILYSLIPMPSLDTLIEATKKSAVSTLEYIFVKIKPLPLTRLSEIEQLRVLKSILHSAYDSGNTRIITICNNLIRDINTANPNMKRKYSDDTPTALAQSVIHSVLGNNKLNSMIMKHVGLIHRSCLGIDQSLIIKGGQLFGNNSLLDFIKYGATEYFIKSFKSINLKHSYPPNNNKLISAAIAHFTPRHIPLLDALIAHPSMTLSPETISWREFINQLSDCTIHNWSRILDDVMQLVMVNSNSPPMILKENDIFLIKHPLFLSKMLSFGVTFTVPRINVHPPPPPPNSEVLTRWLQCPPESILEMIQLIGQPLSKETARHVLAHSIRMDIQPVSQYFIDTYQLLNEPRLPAFCAKHGYFELYNTLPQSTNNSNLLFETILQCEKCLMPLEVVTMAYQHMIDNGVRPTTSFSSKMPRGLICPNKINLLVSLPHHNGNNDQLVRITNIIPIMISVGLLERFLADSRYQCDFDYVMSSAIEVGDRQVIEMLEANTDKRFKTDYRSAFNAAASVGDLDTINMILDKRHLSTATDHKIFGNRHSTLQNIHPDVATIVIDQQKLDGRTTMFEQVMSLFVEYFKRGDIEAIDHLIRQCIDCRVNDPGELDSNIKFGIHSLLSHKMTPITNSKVLAHFIDKGYLDMVNKQHYLTRVIEHACENGHIDIMRFVHSLDQIDQSISFIPDLRCIARIVERNQLSVIQYLFGDDQSPIKRSPDATLVVRMAKYARHSAFVNGNINIINYCDTIIV
ncbi:hypothetical protein SAMD00019534_098280 [Acytostelium subglobosum LB1]|uniref:hypothetical protein n=1 Tax=Acytostelium subglobosum LB1 TaxID=1410327 RepID=UPI00064483E4|nr:hypothetical protein SAMD00019534_098280 [Acytostelium subglobosum LB1]GAM26653.1 hypothetical protein SAMD00019534_098280 [Acytostelium subglobosum LB1]|eukprot:XP_012750314.1 hypothetical protein SAMD00019534_098280 [Acytostelium subglobosum LB1]